MRTLLMGRFFKIHFHCGLGQQEGGWTMMGVDEVSIAKRLTRIMQAAWEQSEKKTTRIGLKLKQQWKASLQWALLKRQGSTKPK